MRAQLANYWSQYFILWMQVFLALGVFVVFAALPRLGELLFRPVENFFSNFTARRKTAVWSIFLAAIAVRAALLPAIGVPFPMGQDERSYLLMSEMFAGGRIAFPQHPLWKSFETFHVNFFPVYASMFPPAQGAILALGRLMGNPWAGVLLSVAAMCAAIVWMLQAWMPSRWAFLGGAMALCNLGVVSYWVNSYWGGAVAAIGGALVLGAVPRIFRNRRIRDGLLLGLGVAILANSRPYEGMVLCIPAVVWLMWWLLRRVRDSSLLSTPVHGAVFGAACVICATAVFMSYYNWRLTGNALLMPHSWNYRMYYRTPLFIWQRAATPIHYNNPQYEDFYNGWVRGLYHGSPGDVMHASLEKVRNLTAVFLWPGVLPILLCVPLALRDRRVRFLFVEFIVGAAGLFLIIQSLPHYAAPFTCVIYGLIVQGLRHLRTIRVNATPVGIGLARASILLLLCNTSFNAYHLIRTPDRPYSWSWNEGKGSPGALAIEWQLDQIPGKHLIVVRYSATHNPHGESVFNHADIDGSRIVWARELDAEQNDKLFSYFKDRQIWLFEPDRDFRTLTPLHIDNSRTKSSPAKPGAS